jgi:hypothetical protein
MAAPISAPREECALCLCKMYRRKRLVETLCNHIFHRACLTGWLISKIGEVRDTCPLCERVDPLGQNISFSEGSDDSMVSMNSDSDEDPSPAIPLLAARVARIVVPVPPVVVRELPKDGQRCRCVLL